MSAPPDSDAPPTGGRPRPGATFRAGMALERRAAKAARRLAARRGPDVIVEPVRLRSTVGYQLQAWIHRPAGATGPLPGVVLCPGIDDGAAVFASHLAPISADEVARLGCVALRFDPAGRGDSWGEEDFGGPEHQDDVATCVRALQDRDDVAADRVGIVCISMGVAMGIGAAAREDLDVAWVLDWEGPSDREIITAGGARMAPADGHTLQDEVYWVPREAVHHVPRLRCPYVRLQAWMDHAQPGETRHAMRMLHAAAEASRDGSIPWFQINDHPRSAVPPRPRWLPPGTWAAHRAVRRKIQVLSAGV